MRRVIAVIGLLLAVSGQAHAQAPPFDWRPPNREAAAMLRAGSDDKAATIIDDALTSCPRAANPQEVALCTAIFTENRAIVLEHRGDLAGAEAGFKTCLSVRQSVLPPSDPLVGQAQFWLALFYERHGRSAEEIEALLAAESIARARGPQHRPEVIGLTARRARALTGLGRNADALPLYQDTYPSSSDQFGPRSKEALTALNNLVGALIGGGFTDAAVQAAQTALASTDVDAFDPTQRARLAGQLAQQVPYPSQYKSALTFAEAALPALNTGTVTDPDATVTLLLGLAHMLALTGEPDRAVELSRRARIMSATSWGQSSYPVAAALRKEAEAEAARHNFAAAIDRLNEASAMVTAPAVLLASLQLEVDRGLVLLRAGRRGEATASHLAFAESPALAQSGPAARAVILALLGDALIRLEAYEQAARLCEESLRQAGGGIGLGAIYRTQVELCLGTARLQQGHAAEAVLAAERARAALWANTVRQSGIEPPLNLQKAILQLKARALRETNRDGEALVALQDNLEVARRIGDGDAEADTWNDLAFLQRKMRLYTEAADSSTRGLTLLGPSGNERRRANLLENRAQLALTLGRPADALPVFEQVLALRRTDPQSELISIATTERDLASALSRVGRNQDAVIHMDAAIDIFRGLGPERRDFLLNALDWLVPVAASLGDMARAERVTRELLTLRDPATGEGAGIRLVLANFLDAQARRTEADTLRAEAVAAMTARFGADSAVVMRTRLSGVAWLRATGRMVEAAAVVRDCLALAATTAELALPCLMAAAETALEAGEYRAAADYSARAVKEVEAHWEQNGASLRDALSLQAGSAAALGDVAGLIRMYDRIHDLTSRQGTNPGWTDLAYAQMLTQAGETTAAQPALRHVLDDAGKARDDALTMAATASIAEYLIQTGANREAIALWTPTLASLTDDVPGRRVSMLTGLGMAQVALARNQDAAASFDQAATTSRILFGQGTPTYFGLVVAQVTALARAGQTAKAEDAIRLLDGDPSPAAALAKNRALVRVAEEADDPVAIIQHARSRLALISVAYGKNSVVEAFARLDLAEALMASGGHADENEVEDAVAVIEAQQPGWRTECRVLRIRAMIASESRQFDAAEALLTAVETRWAAHEGDNSVNRAAVRADRAATRLHKGDAAGADALFRQALALAAPDGDWHNALWAQIATGAAIAAERTDDSRRAIQLRRDAAALLPAAASRQTYRWL